MDINAELTNNPDLIPQVIEVLKGQNYVIRNETEENEFRSNLIKNELPSHLNPKVKEIYDRYDKDVFDSSGISRDQDEKSYNYAKRVITNLKGEVDRLKSEYESLKSSTSGSDELKAQYDSKVEEIRKNSETAISEWENKYNELESKSSVFAKKAEIDNIMAPLRRDFKSEKDLGQFFKSHEQQVLSSVISNSKKIESGEFVMLEADGSVMLDKTTMKAVSVGDYLKDQFKDAIKPPNNKNGAGSGKGNGNNRGDIDPNLIKAEEYPIDKYESLNDLLDGMMKDGIPRSSELFTEIWKRASEKGIKIKF